MTTTQTNLLTCSFCGKSSEQVKKLIAGPGVYICDECIGLCNEILDEETVDQDALERHAVESGPLEAVLPIFRSMAETANTTEERMSAWAKTLARRGVSLSTIADHAGLDERSAAERFGI